MIAVDSRVLGFLINPGAVVPNDPTTDMPITQFKERIEYLKAELDRQQSTILIPTPALAEALVIAEHAGPEMVAKLTASSKFQIVDFDQRAAIELAFMTRKSMDAGDKREGSSDPYQKIKVDRQIVAIARVNGATTLYSNDKSLGTFATLAGLKVIKLHEMPVPPLPAQADLPLYAPPTPSVEI